MTAASNPTRPTKAHLRRRLVVGVGTHARTAEARQRETRLVRVTLIRVSMCDGGHLINRSAHAGRENGNSVRAAGVNATDWRAEGGIGEHPSVWRRGYAAADRHQLRCRWMPCSGGAIGGRAVA
jgi:hypothetical protein